METTQKPMKKLLKFVGSLISWIFKGVLILVLILFVAMGIKIIERWNQPMQIPEAQGMIYSELIKNRLDGWNRNQDRYGESTMHCKVLWGGGLVISFPLQLIYTFVSYEMDSNIVNYLDSRDISEGFVPDVQMGINPLTRWWWTVEKFTWGIMVEGVSSTPSILCGLLYP